MEVSQALSKEGRLSTQRSAWLLRRRLQNWAVGTGNEEEGSEESPGCSERSLFLGQTAPPRLIVAPLQELWFPPSGQVAGGLLSLAWLVPSI